MLYEQKQLIISNLCPSQGIKFGKRNADPGMVDPERRGFALMAPAMTPSEQENEQRRAIEALAQSLYEAEERVGIAWTRRAAIIGEPWLARARRQLQAARSRSQRRLFTVGIRTCLSD